MNTIIYKKCAARIDYSDEDGYLMGHIANINDVVGFHGEIFHPTQERNCAWNENVLLIMTRNCLRCMTGMFTARSAVADFLSKASRFAVGGITAAALLESLMPDYALAQQVAKDDERITVKYQEYESPEGHGKMRGYLAQPAKAEGKLPGVVVVHENRGLNPYVEDVARRLGIAGFLAFAPDALTPLGGYPGTDDEGRRMQRELDGNKITEDFIAAARFLKAHSACSGKVGVVGFCFGGGMSNTLAVRIPDVISAAVPFYGRQSAAEDVPKIKAALLIHYAALDNRVNKGWPAYEAALKEAGVNYTAHMYGETNHGFHNDTTPRYDEAAAKLAWQRTVDGLVKSQNRAQIDDHQPRKSLCHSGSI